VTEAMADIALVFHWPPSELDPMSLRDLALWWRRARDRLQPPE
jgi:hypothetical protein